MDGPIPVGHFLSFSVFLPANKTGKDAVLEGVGGHRYSAVYAQGIGIRSNPTFAFETPTHDVTCQVDEHEGLLECQLASGQIRPHPAECLAYRLIGYSLERAGRAEIMCGRRGFISNRTIMRSVLRRSGFTCVLRASGVRCRNRGGHGFLVSTGRSYKF